MRYNAKKNCVTTIMDETNLKLLIHVPPHANVIFFVAIVENEKGEKHEVDLTPYLQPLD